MLSSDETEDANTSATGRTASTEMTVKNITAAVLAALLYELSCGRIYLLFPEPEFFTSVPPHTSALSLSIFFVMILAMTSRIQPTALCKKAAAEE